MAMQQEMMMNRGGEGADAFAQADAEAAARAAAGEQSAAEYVAMQ